MFLPEKAARWAINMRRSREIGRRRRHTGSAVVSQLGRRLSSAAVAKKGKTRGSECESRVNRRWSLALSMQPSALSAAVLPRTHSSHPRPILRVFSASRPLRIQKEERGGDSRGGERERERDREGRETLAKFNACVNEGAGRPTDRLKVWHAAIVFLITIVSTANEERGSPPPLFPSLPASCDTAEIGAYNLISKTI